jgi:hypothetical protein
MDPPPVDPPPVDPPPVDPPPKDPPPDPGGPPGIGWRLERTEEEAERWRKVMDGAPPGLQAACGPCHAVPSPDVYPRRHWPRVFGEMDAFADARRIPRPKPPERQELLEWYMKNAPDSFVPLQHFDVDGPVAFERKAIGGAPGRIPWVTNVAAIDVDADKTPEIVVCEGMKHGVSILRRDGASWSETFVGSVPVPGHAAATDLDRDGDLDLVIAGLGSTVPTDALTGTVGLAWNDGAKGWRMEVIAKDLPRVADVEPGDFDGDGDLDLSVAAFGWRTVGFVGWLRNDGGSWTMQRLLEKAGGIHVPVLDLDGDGRLDILALVSQETESVVVFLNRKDGFEAKVLFDARNPLFGSSGIQPVDMDRDGDTDILLSNGDALDDPQGEPKPYHGVQWLENLGKLEFRWREIARMDGPYRAVAADLDGDGDLDVAAAALFARWAALSARSLAWFENDGKMGFQARGIASLPTHLVSLDAADLDGDGDVDLVAGRLAYSGGAAGPGDAVTAWFNGRK